jgi:hypothetical protein
MKYIFLLASFIFLVLTTQSKSYAIGDEYQLILYELQKVNRTNPNKTTNNINPNIPVQQDLHIESGSFNIKVLSSNLNRSQMYKYKNKLTRLKERRDYINKWKIALKTSDINAQIHQQNMREMLRQLNAQEEKNSSEHRERNISGWKVRIQEDLMTDHLLKQRAIDELRKQLIKIRTRVPYQAMVKLQEVEIYLYKNKPGVQKSVTAYYSPLYKAVIFHDAEKLHNLSERQNAVVLHELAHGYHDKVLGYNNTDIKAAYENAVKTGLYKNVKVQDGRIAPRAYALENHIEYFAELSETYFSRKYGSFENDYFPFNKYELKEYDPMGYDMAQEMWGR